MIIPKNILLSNWYIQMMQIIIWYAMQFYLLLLSQYMYQFMVGIYKWYNLSFS